jgi:hypothetical protein
MAPALMEGSISTLSCVQGHDWKGRSYSCMVVCFSCFLCCSEVNSIAGRPFYLLAYGNNPYRPVYNLSAEIPGGAGFFCRPSAQNPAFRVLTCQGSSLESGYSQHSRCFLSALQGCEHRASGVEWGEPGRALSFSIASRSNLGDVSVPLIACRSNQRLFPSLCPLHSLPGHARQQESSH